MQRIINRLILTLGILSLWTLFTTAAQAQTFAPTACPIDTPANVMVDCGTVTVTADRARDTGAIDIAIMHYRSDHPDAPPVFLLAGGPGLSGILSFGMDYEASIAPFLAERDVIIFDQRGVGLSGALTCASGVSVGGARFDMAFPGAVFADFFSQTIADCGAQFAADRVNVAAYTSAASAADIADIAAALGYETINLYGSSYGTRYAQAVMADYPDLLNAVVLDSALPAAISPAAEALAAFNHALETLFTACETDAYCAAAYPNLRADFDTALENLAAESVTIDGISRESGATFPVAVNNNVFLGIIFNGFYSPETVRLLPGAISGTAVGDYILLGQIAGAFLAPEGNIAGMLADGMQYAVTCGEETAFEQRAAVEASLAAFPHLAYPLYTGPQLGPEIFDACATWAIAAPDAMWNQPVISTLPTLILGGQFDMITPTYWSAAMVHNLPNGTFYEFPGLAHVTAAGDNCPMLMVQDFLRDPATAPADCRAAMPALTFEIVPRTTAAVAEATPTDAAAEEATDTPPAATASDMGDILLVPVDDVSGARVLVPEGWIEAGDSTFAAPDGSVILTQQAVTAPSADFVLPVVAVQIGVNDLGDPTEIVTGDVTWRRYTVTVEGRAVEIAVAEQSSVYLVLMNAPLEQRDALVEAVFLPALAGFNAAE